MNCDWCGRSFNEKKSEGVCPGCGGLHTVDFGKEKSQKQKDFDEVQELARRARELAEEKERMKNTKAGSKSKKRNPLVSIVFLIAFFAIMSNFSSIMGIFTSETVDYSEEVAIQEPVEDETGIPSEYASREQFTAEIDENGNVIPMEVPDYAVLVIPEGAKHIPEYAFYDDYITAVIFPETLESIGDYAFFSCYSLEYAKLNEGLKYVGNRAFSGYDADEDSIVFGDLPSTLEEVGDFAFSHWNEDSLSDQMAYSGWALQDIPRNLKLGIASFDFSDYPIGDAQDGMVIINDVLVKYVGSSKNITIPEGIRVIDAFAFLENESIETVVMANTVERIGVRSFYKNDSLTTVTFSTNLKSISDEAFYGSEKLQAAYLPEGMTTAGDDIFSGCESLHELYIPNSLTDVTGDSFVYSAWYYDNYIGGRTSWIIGDSNLVHYVVEYGEKIVYLPEVKRIASNYVIIIQKEDPDEIIVPEGVTEIGRSAFMFSGQEDIIIDLPDSVVNIEGRLDTGFSMGAMEVDIRCNVGTYAHDYALANGYGIIPKS